MTMTYGESFAESIRSYLQANNLPSLGKINGKILGELADHFHGKWMAAHREKKVRERRKDGPEYQVPPVREAVTQHIAAMGYTFTALEFFAYYEARDWKPKGCSQRLANWHAACVTFQKNTGQPRRVPVAVTGTLFPDEPQGWRTWARANLMNPAQADRPWASFGKDERAAILRGMNQGAAK